MAGERMKFSERKQDATKGPAPARRKLQLNGLGVTYRMNERTAIESGIRLGIGPNNSSAEPFGATLPSQGSTGGFITLRRQIGGR
jgi:hypothetical protein